FGALIYLLAVRPVLAFDRFSFAWLVSTLGVATILEAGAALIWGPTSRGFPTMLNGRPVHLLGAVISLQQVLAIAAGVVAVAAFELFRRRTLFGKLGMAIAADPEIASAIGANTQAVAVAAFALAGLLAGVAGVLVGPITFANPYIGSTSAGTRGCRTSRPGPQCGRCCPARTGTAGPWPRRPTRRWPWSAWVPGPASEWPRSRTAWSS